MNYVPGQKTRGYLLSDDYSYNETATMICKISND